MRNAVLWILFVAFANLAEAEIKVFQVRLPEPCNTVSNVATIPDETESITVYPTPSVNGVVNIHFGKTVMVSNPAVVVSDMVGKTVFVGKGTIDSDTNTCSLRLDLLSDGMYFLNLMWKDRSVSRRIIINRQNPPAL